MSNIYKPVKGYKNLLAGSDGTIWSLSYKNTGKIKKLSVTSNGAGYLGLTIRFKGMNKHKRFHVHRLIPEKNYLKYIMLVLHKSVISLAVKAGVTYYEKQ